MQIQIWSDLSCPFCVIGKKHLSQALALFAEKRGKQDVEIVHRSFELDPEAFADAGGDLNALLAKKYGKSVEVVQQMTANIAKQASILGLEFNFDRVIPTNTFDAHRLMHFAAERGQAGALEELLFKAYFTDGLNLGEREVLERLAAEAGLDQQEVYEFLISDEYALAVRVDEQTAQKLDIKGVPFFVIDQKYAISGAQPVEAFLQVFEKLLEDDAELEADQANETDGPSCSNGVCT